MPRIKELKPQYMENDLGGRIVGLMYRQGIKQEEIARELNISQPAMSYKLRNNSFSYKDLVQIFSILDLPDSEIIGLMKK